MALAGLWETWKSRASNETTRSFTIVTTTPNALCGELHNRMPAILPSSTWPAWLGEEPAEPNELKSLLVLCAGEMVCWPVSRRVGNSQEQRPESDRADRCLASRLGYGAISASCMARRSNGAAKPRRPSIRAAQAIKLAQPERSLSLSRANAMSA